MPTVKASSDKTSAKPVLFLVGALVLAAGAVRFFSERADPRSGHAHDRIYYIDLEPLPAGWETEWAAEEDSARRLKLLSPQRDSVVQVFAFKGELDRGKLNAIVDSLYNEKLPVVQSSGVVTDYGMEVERREYERPISSGRIIHTTVDLLWVEARQDYAYIVASDATRPSSPSVQLAKGALVICPPRSTVVGRAARMLGNLTDHIELLIGLFMWFAATIWGLRYTTKWLDTKWKLAKYIFFICLLVSPMVAHGLFGLNWLLALLAPTLVLILVGASAAFVSGRWELED